MSPLLLLRRLVELLALPVALVAIWWFATAGSTSFYVPPLSRIVEVFPATWFEGRLTADILPSMLRLLTGYLLAVVVGVSLGIAIGSSLTLRRIVEPPLEFMRAIPPPVLVPVLIVIFGIGDVSKVIVIFSGCVWPILLNTTEGVRAIDPTLRDAAAAYGLGPLTRLRVLLLRGASPQIMAGCRLSLAIALILMVISEMVAANNGLGFTVVQFQRGFAIPQMYSGIIVLGLIGVVLALAFRVVEARVLAWYFGIRAAERKG